MSTLDLLHVPIVGRFLAWRWGRLLCQLSLMALAALVLYHGFAGPSLAPANFATVLPWIHYRGVILLVLLLAGNFFCFACPFALPRSLARRLSVAGSRWPRRLRNKWISIAGLITIFWLYEWLDLWNSPWLTAWLVVAYFVAAFALEALFSASPFCKYICPLGAFNFVYSTLSPVQITSREQEVCAQCVGRECVRGSASVPGCGTNLYVPMMRSNLDCTFCLDCARACPHDNVSLKIRSPLREVADRRWRPQTDVLFLLVALTTFALSNAFGMVEPVHRVLGWMQVNLSIQHEGVRLLILLGLLNLALPALLLAGGAWLSARLSGPPFPSRRQMAARYVPVFVPLGFGIWLAHYGFHFATAGLSIVPLAQSALLDLGLEWLGTAANWELGPILPYSMLFPLQVAAVLGGFAVALYLLAARSLKAQTSPARAFGGMLPWALFVTGIAIAALLLFDLPMEMRGTMQFMSG